MAFLKFSLFVPIVVFIISLIGMIVLFFIAKRDQIISPKKIIFLVLIGALILALPSTLIFTGLPFISALYFFSAVYSLLIGYIYIIYYPRMLLKPEQESRWWFFLILLTTALMGASYIVVIFYFLSDINYGLMAFYPILYVFIPFFFKSTLESLLDIPLEIYRVWYYGEAQETKWFDDDFNRMFVFEIELYKKCADVNLTKITAKAPENIVFKVWFQRFLDDFNKKNPQKPIERATCNEQSFGWIFYVKPRFWPIKRPINFDKTILENKITGRDTIVAKRVAERKEIDLSEPLPANQESLIVSEDDETKGETKNEQEVQISKEPLPENESGNTNIPGSNIAQTLKSTPEQTIKQAESKLQAQITKYIPKI